jgi:hypothetical protein
MWFRDWFDSWFRRDRNNNNNDDDTHNDDDNHHDNDDNNDNDNDPRVRAFARKTKAELMSECEAMAGGPQKGFCFANAGQQLGLKIRQFKLDNGINEEEQDMIFHWLKDLIGMNDDVYEVIDEEPMDEIIDDDCYDCD